MDMQVVRLQNLSWSASAPDIRGFFSGLNIPSGGVHIIGGKDGDCFVVFGSVDDARRAVLLDRKELNGQRVRLRYSDIDEMQDVIAIAKGEKPAVKTHDRPLSPFTGRKRAASPVYNQPPSKYTDRNRLGEDVNVGRRDDRDTDRNRRYYANDNRHGKNDREDNYQQNSGGNATQSVSSERNRDRSQFDLSNNWNQPNSNQMYQLNNPSEFRQSVGHSDVPVDEHVVEKLRQEALKTLSESQMNILQSALGLVNQNKRPAVPSLLEGIDMRNGNERFESDIRGLGNAHSANTGGRFTDSRDELTRNNRSAGHETRRSFDDHTGNRSRDLNMSASFAHNKSQQGRSADGRDRGQFDDNKREDFNNRSNNRGRGGFNMRVTEHTEQNQFSKRSNRGERDSFDNVPHGQFNRTFDGSQADHLFHGRNSLQPVDNSNRDRRQSDKNYLGNREQSDPFSATRISRLSERSPINTGRMVQGAGQDFSREENSRRLNVKQNERPSSDTLSNQPSTQLYGWKDFPNQGPKDARPTLLPTPTLPPADMDSRDSTGLSQYSSEVKPIIPVTDQCVIMLDLPPTASFKQLRGLFATHNMSPENIVIVRDAAGAVIKAYAKLDNIGMAAEALNELMGMKVSGRAIRLVPCSLAEYEDADKNYSVPGRRSFPLSSREPPAPFRHSRADPTDRPGRPSFPLRAHGNDRIIPLMDQDDRPPMISRGPPIASGGRRPMERSDDQRGRPSSHERRSRDDRLRTARVADRPYDDRRSSISRNDSDRKESVGSSRYRDTDHRSDRKPSEFSRRGSHSVERSKKDDTSQRQESSSRDFKKKDNERDKTDECSGDQAKETAEVRSTENSHGKLDLCLIFTDLPPKCTDDDMKKALESYKYNPGSLYIEYNQRKSCTGTAYVEMGCEADFNKLRNTKIQVLGQTIQINAITKKQMAEYTKDHKAKFPMSDNGEYIIQLCGLPFDATIGIVKNFLHPAQIEDSNIRILQRPDGRCNGFGFVQVKSEKDKDEAMKHDKGYIGKRYVNMKIVSKELMDGFLETNETKITEGETSSTVKTDVIMRLANIRYDVREDQVEVFFREFGPIRGSVKIAMFNGMPTGRAVIRFVTQESAESAKKELDGADLNGRPIRISLLPS